MDKKMKNVEWSPDARRETADRRLDGRPLMVQSDWVLLCLAILGQIHDNIIKSSQIY